MKMERHTHTTVNCEWCLSRRKEQTSQRRNRRQKKSHRKWDRGNRSAFECVREDSSCCRCGRERFHLFIQNCEFSTRYNGTGFRIVWSACLQYLPICWMVSDKIFFASLATERQILRYDMNATCHKCVRESNGWWIYGDPACARINRTWDASR